jgi:hypothetical protein
VKEMSLKVAAKKSEEATMPVMKEHYPSFHVENAPDEMMKCDMGKEMMAKVKVASKDKHEGMNGRQSMGFDVISMMVDDTDEKVKAAHEKGKAIADQMKKEKMSKKRMPM